MASQSDFNLIIQVNFNFFSNIFFNKKTDLIKTTATQDQINYIESIMSAA